jgi:hypothetical protein
MQSIGDIAVPQAMGLDTLATALANKLARIASSILRNEKLFDIHRHEVMAI